MIEEFDVFINDKSFDVYECVVDCFLVVEEFGEWMVLFWMDVVCYGDMSVFYVDGLCDMWLWCDWVI